jgi:hypothetical protein
MLAFISPPLAQAPYTIMWYIRRENIQRDLDFWQAFNSEPTTNLYKLRKQISFEGVSRFINIETLPLLVVWKNRMCQELFVHTRIPDHFFQTEKENAEENETLLLVLISLYWETVGYIQQWHVKDLQGDLLTTGFGIDASTVRLWLLETGRKARKN